jgi:hypothetical protein
MRPRCLPLPRSIWRALWRSSFRVAGGRLLSRLRKVRMAAPMPLLLRVDTPPDPSPGGQQRRCAGRWLASRHAIIRGCHGRSADGRRARGRAIGTRAATHSDPPPLTLCSTLRARLHPLGEAARRRAGDRHLGRSEEKPPPRSCSKRGIQPSTAPERRRNRAVTTAGKAPTPANDDSQPRKSAPRLIRSLLASCLFAAALVHANGSFLMAAVLPGVPAVLAPYHPPGLGEGEQTVR